MPGFFNSTSIFSMEKPLCTAPNIFSLIFSSKVLELDHLQFASSSFSNGVFYIERIDSETIKIEYVPKEADTDGSIDSKSDMDDSPNMLYNKPFVKTFSKPISSTLPCDYVFYKSYSIDCCVFQEIGTYLIFRDQMESTVINGYFDSLKAGAKPRGSDFDKVNFENIFNLASDLKAGKEYFYNQVAENIINIKVSNEISNNRDEFRIDLSIPYEDFRRSANFKGVEISLKIATKDDGIVKTHQIHDSKDALLGKDRAPENSLADSIESSLHISDSARAKEADTPNPALAKDSDLCNGADLHTFSIKTRTNDTFIKILKSFKKNESYDVIRIKTNSLSMEISKYYEQVNKRVKRGFVVKQQWIKDHEAIEDEKYGSIIRIAEKIMSEFK